MATQPATRKLSEEEYLELDRANDYRSEYINGEMIAMAGGSPRHSVITVNCSSQIRARLAGRSCYVFSPDMRLLTPANRSYAYPDVSVVCGEATFKPNSSDVLTNPSLIVEVLSPSTETYDKSIKFSLYKDLVSLQEYLMVSTDRVNVWHYSRLPDNSWLFREYAQIEAEMPIPSLNLTLSLGEIYANAMSLAS